MSFTWQNGRQLQSITKGTNTYSYTYDADGLRTSKTVNGVTTNYYTIEGTLLAETKGNDTIRYLQDNNGKHYGFIYNGTMYYYTFNLQGDVTGILDSTGVKVVEYTYDIWGKVLSVTGTLASTIGQINPIRYRGYYYDSETGFYLTGTRYYDPEIGRFINADGYVSTGQGVLGYNMFAYCGNNPVNNIDTTGKYFERSAGGGGGGGWGYMNFDSVRYGGYPYAPGTSDAYSMYAAGAVAVATTSIVIGLSSEALRQEKFAIKRKERAVAQEKDIDVAIPATPPSNGTTYYHVTTPANAVSIASSLIMTGSSWEGGYVYAWRAKPNKYAIKNSGSHFGVIISFKTNASFSTDNGINDPKVLKYGPVVSDTPGPIVVWDVKIVG